MNFYIENLLSEILISDKNISFSFFSFLMLIFLLCDVYMIPTILTIFKYTVALHIQCRESVITSHFQNYDNISSVLLGLIF